MVKIFCKLCLQPVTPRNWKPHIAQKQHLQQLPCKIVVEGAFKQSEVGKVYEYFSKFGGIRGQSVTNQGDEVSVEYRFWDARVYSEIIHQEHSLFDDEIEISWYKKPKSGLLQHVVQDEKMRREKFVYRKLAILNHLKEQPTFDEQLTLLQNKLQTIKTEFDAKRNIINNDLDDILRTNFPHSKIHFFGSSITDLDIHDSDLNIYIDNTDSELPTLENIENLIITSTLFTRISLNTESETPTIKCEHKKTKVCCEVNIRNELPVGKSELIKFYLTLDQKLRHLMVLIKFWVDCCDLRHENAFSSYAICLMVLFYLQQEPYNLPSVADLQKDIPPDEVDGWNCTFGPVEFMNSNLEKVTIFELMVGFLEFYSNFDYMSKVVSPYLGSPIEKVFFLEPCVLPACFEGYLNQDKIFVTNSGICVQDVFEHSKNVSLSVDITSTGKFTAMCRKSLELLRSNDKVLSKLLFVPDETLTEFSIKNNDYCDEHEWISRIETVVLKILKQICSCNVVEKFDDTNVFYSCTGNFNIWDNRVEVLKNLISQFSFDLNTTNCIDKEVDVTIHIIKNSSQNTSWKMIVLLKFEVDPCRVRISFTEEENIPLLHIQHFLYVMLMEALSNKIEISMARHDTFAKQLEDTFEVEKTVDCLSKNDESSNDLAQSADKQEELILNDSLSTAKSNVKSQNQENSRTTETSDTPVTIENVTPNQLKKITFCETQTQMVTVTKTTEILDTYSNIQKEREVVSDSCSTAKDFDTSIVLQEIEAVIDQSEAENACIGTEVTLNTTVVNLESGEKYNEKDVTYELKLCASDIGEKQPIEQKRSDAETVSVVEDLIESKHLSSTNCVEDSASNESMQQQNVPTVGGLETVGLSDNVAVGLLAEEKEDQEYPGDKSSIEDQEHPVDKFSTEHQGGPINKSSIKCEEALVVINQNENLSTGEDIEMVDLSGDDQEMESTMEESASKESQVKSSTNHVEDNVFMQNVPTVCGLETVGLSDNLAVSLQAEEKEDQEAPLDKSSIEDQEDPVDKPIKGEKLQVILNRNENLSPGEDIEMVNLSGGDQKMESTMEENVSKESQDAKEGVLAEETKTNSVASKEKIIEEEDLSPNISPQIENINLGFDVLKNCVTNAIKTLPTFEDQLNVILNKVQIDKTYTEKSFSLIYDDLTAALSSTYPNNEIYFYDSLVTSLTIDENCLNIKVANLLHGLTARSLLNTIEQLLIQCQKFDAISMCSKSKNLFIECIHTKTKILCHLTLRNKIALRNVDLLRYYLSLDEKIHTLILLVQFWMKCYDLHSPIFTDIHLLVIFYLQHEPYKLPSVMELQKNAFREEENGWNCAFTPIEFANSALQDSTFLSLFYGFLKFYEQFDYMDYVVSTYTGSAVKKVNFMKPFDLPEAYGDYMNRHDLLKLETVCCVQDPFAHTKNVWVNACAQKAFSRFVSLCRASLDLFSDEKELLNNLFLQSDSSIADLHTFYLDKPNEEEFTEWMKFVKNVLFITFSEILACYFHVDFKDPKEYTVYLEGNFSLFEKRALVLKGVTDWEPDISEFEKEIDLASHIVNLNPYEKKPWKAQVELAFLPNPWRVKVRVNGEECLHLCHFLRTRLSKFLEESRKIEEYLDSRFPSDEEGEESDASEPALPSHIADQIKTGSTFTDQMKILHDTLLTNGSDIENKYTLVSNQLTSILLETFPNHTIHLYGSRALNLDLPTSKYDIYIDLGMLFHMNHQKQLKDLLVSHDAFDNISGGKDFIECLHVSTNTICVLYTQNKIRLKTTDLIRYYCNIDEKIPILMKFIKFWSQQYALTKKNGLNSCSLYLLVIFYLQRTTNFPTVASLLEIGKSQTRDWNCDFTPIHFNVTLKDVPISELLRGFFNFYSDFAYLSHVITPFYLKTLSKYKFLRPYRNLPANYEQYKRAKKGLDLTSGLCIQDPFQHNNNVSLATSRETIGQFVALCRAALHEDYDDLISLFSFRSPRIFNTFQIVKNSVETNTTWRKLVETRIWYTLQKITSCVLNEVYTDSDVTKYAMLQPVNIWDNRMVCFQNLPSGTFWEKELFATLETMKNQALVMLKAIEVELRFFKSPFRVDFVVKGAHEKSHFVHVIYSNVKNPIMSGTRVPVSSTAEVAEAETETEDCSYLNNIVTQIGKASTFAEQISILPKRLESEKQTFATNVAKARADLLDLSSSSDLIKEVVFVGVPAWNLKLRTTPAQFYIDFKADNDMRANLKLLVPLLEESQKFTEMKLSRRTRKYHFLKCVHLDTKLVCQLFLVNYFPTDPLQYYANFDQKISQLFLFITFWAGCYPPSNPIFQPDGLYLLVIFYLQQEPYKLPTIATLLEARPVLKYPKFSNPILEKTSITELVKGFFDFYSAFDYFTQVVSTFRGIPMEKHHFVSPLPIISYKKGRPDLILDVQPWLCVQNPQQAERPSENIVFKESHLASAKFAARCRHSRVLMDKAEKDFLPDWLQSEHFDHPYFEFSNRTGIAHQRWTKIMLGRFLTIAVELLEFTVEKRSSDGDFTFRCRVRFDSPAVLTFKGYLKRADPEGSAWEKDKGLFLHILDRNSVEDMEFRVTFDDSPSRMIVTAVTANEVQFHYLHIFYTRLMKFWPREERDVSLLVEPVHLEDFLQILEQIPTFTDQVTFLEWSLDACRNEMMTNYRLVMQDLKSTLSCALPKITFNFYDTDITGYNVPKPDFIHIWIDGVDIQNTTLNLMEHALSDSYKFTQVLIQGPFENCIHGEHVDTHVRFELNVKNELAVCTSELIRYYTFLDSRITSLLTIVKFWVDLVENKFTNGCVSLMVIFYLQVVYKLPAVADLSVDSKGEINSPKDPLGQLEDSTLFDLLREFFHFYNTFDYINYVISPYFGSIIEKTRLLKPYDLPNSENYVQENVELSLTSNIDVQDPFQLYKNLTVHMTHEDLGLFIARCRHALPLLHDQTLSFIVKYLEYDHHNITYTIEKEQQDSQQWLQMIKVGLTNLLKGVLDSSDEFSENEVPGTLFSWVCKGRRNVWEYRVYAAKRLLLPAGISNVDREIAVTRAVNAQFFQLTEPWELNVEVFYEEGFDVVTICIKKASSAQLGNFIGHFLYVQLVKALNGGVTITGQGLSQGGFDSITRLLMNNKLKTSSTLATQTEVIRTVLRINETKFEQKRNIIERNLQSALKSLHPVQIVFGFHLLSSENLNIYIATDALPDHTNAELLQTVKELICHSVKFSDVFLMSHNQSVRCIHTKTQTICEININDKCLEVRRGLLEYYSSLDDNIPHLMCFVKFWADCNQLTGVYGFSSDAIYTMVIFFLQVQYKIPFVKQLQEKITSIYKDGWNCAFAQPSLMNDELRCSTIRDLVLRFFDFYGNFDYITQVISPFLGEPIAKVLFLKCCKLPGSFYRYVINHKPIPIDAGICIQDFFNHSKNLSSAQLYLSGKFARLCRVSIHLVNESEGNFFARSIVDHRILYKMCCENFKDAEETLQFTEQIFKTKFGCTITPCKLDDALKHDLTYDVWTNRIPSLDDVNQKSGVFEKEVGVTSEESSHKVWTKFSIGIKNHFREIDIQLKTMDFPLMFHLCHFIHVNFSKSLKAKVTESVVGALDQLLPSVCATSSLYESSSSQEKIECFGDIDDEVVELEVYDSDSSMEVIESYNEIIEIADSPDPIVVANDDVDVLPSSICASVNNVNSSLPNKTEAANTVEDTINESSLQDPKNSSSPSSAPDDSVDSFSQNKSETANTVENTIIQSSFEVPKNSSNPNSAPDNSVDSSSQNKSEMANTVEKTINQSSLQVSKNSSSSKVAHLHQKNLPTFAEQVSFLCKSIKTNKLALKKKLHEISNNLTKLIKLRNISIYGSSVTGLHVQNSDVNIHVDTLPFGVIHKFHFASAYFKDLKMKDPSNIECVHFPTKLRLTLTTKSDIAVQISQLINYYLSLHEILPLVVIVLKHWASCHSLTLTAITGYMIELMLIFYLQVKYKIPSVVHLQKTCSCVFLNNWNCGFDKTVIASLPKSVTILDLVKGFFKFYGDFDYFSLVVAPFYGTPIAKTRFIKPFNMPEQYSTYVRRAKELIVDAGMCIQCPFEHSNNVSVSISYASAAGFAAFCRQAVARMDLLEEKMLDDLLVFGKEDLNIKLSLQKPGNLVYEAWVDSVKSLTPRILTDVLGGTISQVKYVGTNTSRYMCNGPYIVLDNRIKTIKNLPKTFASNVSFIDKEIAVTKRIMKNRSASNQMRWKLEVQLVTEENPARISLLFNGPMEVSNFMYSRIVKILNSKEKPTQSVSPAKKIEDASDKSKTPSTSKKQVDPSFLTEQKTPQSASKKDNEEPEPWNRNEEQVELPNSGNCEDSASTISAVASREPVELPSSESESSKKMEELDDSTDKLADQETSQSVSSKKRKIEHSPESCERKKVKGGSRDSSTSSKEEIISISSELKPSDTVSNDKKESTSESITKKIVNESERVSVPLGTTSQCISTNNSASPDAKIEKCRDGNKSPVAKLRTDFSPSSETQLSEVEEGVQMSFTSTVLSATPSTSTSQSLTSTDFATTSDNSKAKLLILENTKDRSSFTGQTSHFCKKILVPEKTIEAQRNIIERDLSSKFPLDKITFIGSSVLGLFSEGDKFDIYIDKLELNLVKIFLIDSQKFYEIIVPPGKQHVKCRHKETKIECEIHVNNRLPVCNNQLIEYYLTLDPKLPQLFFVIKYWAESNELKKVSSFSNYAINLLIIFYLQQKPYKLPSVSELQKDATPDYIDGWNGAFTPTQFNSQALKEATIRDLVIGFFEFYSSFDYFTNVIAPYIGTPINKACFLRPFDLPSCYQDFIKRNYLFMFMEFGLWVQDPFEHTTNVTASVDLANMGRFAALCRSALQLVVLTERQLLYRLMTQCQNTSIVDYDGIEIVKKENWDAQHWLNTVKSVMFAILSNILCCDILQVQQMRLNEGNRKIKIGNKVRTGEVDQVIVICMGLKNIWEGRINILKLWMEQIPLGSTCFGVDMFVSNFIKNDVQRISAFDLTVKITFMKEPISVRIAVNEENKLHFTHFIYTRMLEALESARPQDEVCNPLPVTSAAFPVNAVSEPYKILVKGNFNFAEILQIQDYFSKFDKITSVKTLGENEKFAVEYCFADLQAYLKIIQDQHTLFNQNLKIIPLAPLKTQIPNANFKNWKLEAIHSFVGCATFEQQVDTLWNQFIYSEETTIKKKHSTIQNNLNCALFSKFSNSKIRAGSDIATLDMESDNLSLYVENVSTHDNLATLQTMKDLISSNKNFCDVSLISEKSDAHIFCKHVKTEINCYLRIRNKLAVSRNQLIKYYLSLDCKLPKFMLLLKFWADCYDLIDVETFSDSAIHLMAIFYLQQDPYKLPTVKDLQDNSKKSLVWNCTYNEVTEFHSPALKTATLLDLFNGFLRFYANFDYVTYVISPYFGSPLDKCRFLKPYCLPKSFKYFLTNRKDLHVNSSVCVQDFFDHSLNLTSSVSMDFMGRFTNLCRASLLFITPDEKLLLYKLLINAQSVFFQYPEFVIEQTAETDDKKWVQQIKTFTLKVLSDILDYKLSALPIFGVGRTNFECVGQHDVWQSRIKAMKKLIQLEVRGVDKEIAITKQVIADFPEAVTWNVFVDLTFVKFPSRVKAVFSQKEECVNVYHVCHFLYTKLMLFLGRGGIEECLDNVEMEESRPTPPPTHTTKDSIDNHHKKKKERSISTKKPAQFKIKPIETETTDFLSFDVTKPLETSDISEDEIPFEPADEASPTEKETDNDDTPSLKRKRKSPEEGEVFDEGEDDDVPSDFFDDFAKEDFLDGLNIVDVCSNEYRNRVKNTSKEGKKASKETKKLSKHKDKTNKCTKEEHKDKTILKSRLSSCVLRKKHSRSNSRTRPTGREHVKSRRPSRSRSRERRVSKTRRSRSGSKSKRRKIRSRSRNRSSRIGRRSRSRSRSKARGRSRSPSPRKVKRRKITSLRRPRKRSTSKDSRSRSPHSRKRMEAKKKSLLEEIREKLNKVKPIAVSTPAYTVESAVTPPTLSSVPSASSRVPAKSFVSYDDSFFIGTSCSESHASPVPPESVLPVPQGVASRAATRQDEHTKQDFAKLFVERKISLCDYLAGTAKQGASLKSAESKDVQEKAKVLSRCQDIIKFLHNNHLPTTHLTVKPSPEPPPSQQRHQSPLAKMCLVSFRFTSPPKQPIEDAYSDTLDKILQKSGVTKEGKKTDPQDLVEVVAKALVQSTVIDKETVARILKETLLGVMDDTKSLGIQSADAVEYSSVGLQVGESKRDNRNVM